MRLSPQFVFPAKTISSSGFFHRFDHTCLGGFFLRLVNLFDIFTLNPGTIPCNDSRRIISDESNELKGIILTEVCLTKVGQDIFVSARLVEM
jgi:hypothetical protein